MKRRDFLKLGIAAPLVAAGIAKAPKPEPSFGEWLMAHKAASDAAHGGYLVPDEYVDDLLVAMRRGSAMRLDNLGLSI